MTWDLESGLVFVRVLERELRVAGYHVGIVGGVLHRGASVNDLDVVVYPRDTTRRNTGRARRVLERLGMVCQSSVRDTWTRWALHGSADRKCVDVWSTLDGRRVDVFWMS